jgi:SAM-dependent methyltransferase
MQQEQVDWFESWFGSPYYHILYEHRDELEAQAFVETLLNYLQPLPMSTMADIACGEGRFSIELAEHGYDVIGVDLSYANIEKAKKYEHENLHFMVHDMRYPFYINYFNYVFNFFTSFGYFATDRDHMMAAKSFAAGMKKGGLLIIDYLNKEQSLAKLVPEETLQRGKYEFNLQRKLENNHFVKDIYFKDSEGRERHYKESVAAFELSDFIRMFKKAGLSLVATFGDYHLNSYHPFDSPRLIMIFKK